MRNKTLNEVYAKLCDVEKAVTALASVDEKTNERLERVEKALMSVATDLEDLRKAMDDATNVVAGRIDKLVGSLKNSMTDTELAAAKAGFQAEIDRLKALGADPQNPVPPAP